MIIGEILDLQRGFIIADVSKELSDYIIYDGHMNYISNDGNVYVLKEIPPKSKRAMLYLPASTEPEKDVTVIDIPNIPKDVKIIPIGISKVFNIKEYMKGNIKVTYFDKEIRYYYKDIGNIRRIYFETLSPVILETTNAKLDIKNHPFKFLYDPSESLYGIPLNNLIKRLFSGLVEFWYLAYIFTNRFTLEFEFLYNDKEIILYLNNIPVYAKDGYLYIGNEKTVPLLEDKVNHIRMNIDQYKNSIDVINDISLKNAKISISLPSKVPVYIKVDELGLPQYLIYGY